jgi:hypothetical protein
MGILGDLCDNRITVKDLKVEMLKPKSILELVAGLIFLAISYHIVSGYI